MFAIIFIQNLLELILEKYNEFLKELISIII